MDDGPTYSISELAAAADVTPRTIRYYAAEGLLPAPEMRGKYAVYSEDHLNRLHLIAQLKAAYFPLSVIKERLGALDAEQVRQALAQPQPTAEQPGSAAEYIANALAQRRSASQPSPPPAPEPSAPPEPSTPEDEPSMDYDEALAEIEEARPLRLQEEAARYEPTPAQAEGALSDRQRLEPDIAREGVAPPPPRIAPALPSARAPAPAAPLASAATSAAPAQPVSESIPAAPASAAPGVPPALAASAAPVPTPDEQRTRVGLLGRQLPRRERALPTPSATGATSEAQPEHWSRVTLAPGVELHIREPAAPGLRERIARLIAEARTILAD